jgi:hypothetical protein
MNIKGNSMSKLIKLMYINGAIDHRHIRPRFWFFLALGIAIVAWGISHIPIPDSFVTSVYWGGAP